MEVDPISISALQKFPQSHIGDAQEEDISQDAQYQQIVITEPFLASISSSGWSI